MPYSTAVPPVVRQRRWGEKSRKSMEGYGDTTHPFIDCQAKRSEARREVNKRRGERRLNDNFVCCAYLWCSHAGQE